MSQVGTVLLPPASWHTFRCFSRLLPHCGYKCLHRFSGAKAGQSLRGSGPKILNDTHKQPSFPPAVKRNKHSSYLPHARTHNSAKKPRKLWQLIQELWQLLKSLRTWVYAYWCANYQHLNVTVVATEKRRSKCSVYTFWSLWGPLKLLKKLSAVTLSFSIKLHIPSN